MNEQMQNLDDASLAVMAIVLIAMSMLALNYWRKIISLKQKTISLELELKAVSKKVDEQKTAIVESKLSPLLFKNIFNSIQSHAYQTYYALDRMAIVLEYILYESKKKFVSPQSEIEFALNLIEVNKIKLSPLFDLKIKTKLGENEPLINQEYLAPLLSVDLIENAFRHVDLQKEDSFIHITFKFFDGCFVLTVANSISSEPFFEKSASGTGSNCLEQRLEILYPECHKLERFVEGNVYIAHLNINLLKHKAKIFQRAI